MPIIHNHILCVTVDELVDLGVSMDAIYSGLRDQRQGLVYCWEHHKHGGRAYIHYESLRNDYKLYIIIEKGANFYVKSIPLRKDFKGNKIA